MNLDIAKTRMSRVFKPDSITVSQGDFLATHVAIKKLHLLNKFELDPSGCRDFSEEEVYDQCVRNEDNRHQFVVVYGQSGTGKSHLIRWLEEKFRQDKQDDEVALFIRRSDNTLKGTIRQLLQLPEVADLPDREIFQRLEKAAVHEDENKLKGRIYHDFVNEVQNDTEDHDVKLNTTNRENLADFLSNEIIRDHLLSSDGPIERIYSKVAEGTNTSIVDRDTIAQFEGTDFKLSVSEFEEISDNGSSKAFKVARAVMAGEKGEKTAENIAAYLNQFVDVVIQHCAGIEAGDFRDIFQEIRKELYRQKKTLTLFIEDITSFTGVDESLLDALIVEHTGMNEQEDLCRISSIVGTTSSYLDKNFRDNHKDRITKFVFIPDDAFDEGSLFEFVGRYLNTMSLPEEAIETWTSNLALESDYPIHDVKEGADWDFVSIGNGKELCLYPFTKKSISYLYQNRLKEGHRTPRYIISEIIEPTVNEIISDLDGFPSEKYEIKNPNHILRRRIESEIKDDRQADRLFRFISIWGDGTPFQYEKNGDVFISSINKNIFEELGLPIINFEDVTSQQPTVENESVTISSETEEKAKESGKIREETLLPTYQKDIQDKVSAAISLLERWDNEHKIDISSSGGASGIIRRAQDDICAFAFSFVNWQAEEVSMDNIDKIERSNVKMITLDQQAKENKQGLYVLPANHESFDVISAFVRWRAYGQTWNYEDSAFDVYIVTDWAIKHKNELVQAVHDDVIPGTRYIEAAIVSEIYRMILFGELDEADLTSLSVKQFLIDPEETKGERECYTNSDEYRKKSGHCNEWKSLVEHMIDDETIMGNRETIRRYFNIQQGKQSSLIVLDNPDFAKTLEKVIEHKLFIPDEAFKAEDPVSLRANVYSTLKYTLDRVDKVAQSEQASGLKRLEQIHKCLGNGEINGNDISGLVKLVKRFYDEADRAQINIPPFSPDDVKSSTAKIAAAINTLSEATRETDHLKILMDFSNDPLVQVSPLIQLLTKVDADLNKAAEQIAGRKKKLADMGQIDESGNRYEEELGKIEECFSLLGEEAQNDC